MHCIANSVQADRVESVFIDGKRVKMPFEFDTEEGWCDAYVPKLFGGVQYVAGEDIDMNEQATEAFKLELVRFKGQVTVHFKDIDA